MTDELLKEADEIEKRAKKVAELYKSTVIEYTTQGSELIDSGEWYNLVWKQNEVIADKAAEIQALSTKVREQEGLLRRAVSYFRAQGAGGFMDIFWQEMEAAITKPIQDKE